MITPQMECFELVSGIVAVENPSQHISDTAEAYASALIDGRPLPNYNFRNLFQVMHKGHKILAVSYGYGTFHLGIASINSDSPGAVGMVSKAAGEGYLGRINVDSSIYLSVTGKKIRPLHRSEPDEHQPRSSEGYWYARNAHP